MQSRQLIIDDLAKDAAMQTLDSDSGGSKASAVGSSLTAGKKPQDGKDDKMEAEIVASPSREPSKESPRGGAQNPAKKKETKKSREDEENQASPNFDYNAWSEARLEKLSKGKVAALIKGANGKGRRFYKDECFDYGMILFNGWSDQVKDVKAAFSYFEKAAMAGHEFAQLKIARCYLSGSGVDKKDINEAIKILGSLAEQGLVKAFAYLGNCFRAQERHSEAIKAYRQAAEMGHTDAKYQLANILLNGEKCLPDVAQGVKLLEELSESPKRVYSISVEVAKKANKDLYFIYRGLSKYKIAPDFVKALKYLERAASAEQPECMYVYGTYLVNGSGSGYGIDKNEPTGLKSIEKASEKGWADASYWLYQHHLDQKQDTKAKECLEKAANDGYEQAIMICAQHAYYGTFGFTQDISAYEDWLLKGVNRGHLVAHHYYGLLHLGFGNDSKAIKDQKNQPIIAFENLATAVKKGGWSSLFSLGTCFYSRPSPSILKNDKMFFSILVHLNKTANYDYKDAVYYHLGVIFQNGWGVPKSIEIAQSMFHKAAILNYPVERQEYDPKLHKKDADVYLANLVPPFSFEACLASIDNDLKILKESQIAEQRIDQKLQRENETRTEHEREIKKDGELIHELKLKRDELRSTTNEVKRKFEMVAEIADKHTANIISDVRNAYNEFVNPRKRRHEAMSPSESTGSSASAGASSIGVAGTPVLLSPAARAATSTTRSTSASATNPAAPNGSASTNAMDSSDASSNADTFTERTETYESASKRQRN